MPDYVWTLSLTRPFKMAPILHKCFDAAWVCLATRSWCQMRSMTCGDTSGSFISSVLCAWFQPPYYNYWVATSKARYSWLTLPSYSGSKTIPLGKSSPILQPPPSPSHPLSSPHLIPRQVSILIIFILPLPRATTYLADFRFCPTTI